MKDLQAYLDEGNSIVDKLEKMRKDVLANMEDEKNKAKETGKMNDKGEVV